MTKKDKKKYIIAIDWRMHGEVEIETNTFEGALFIASSDSSIELPKGEYIDSSSKVDEDMSRILNEDKLKNMNYKGGRKFQLNPFNRDYAFKKTSIRCPHCEKTFDLKSLSKNDWGIEEGYLIVRCSFCGEVFKVLVNE